MIKQQISDIVDLVFDTDKKDNEIQRSYDKYIETVDKDSYTPIVSNNTDTLLELLKIVNKNLRDDIEYFLYEAPLFWKDNEPVEINNGGAVYKIHNQKEAKDYILNYYGD